MATDLDLDGGFSSSEDDDLDDEKVDYNQSQKQQVTGNIKTQSTSPSQALSQQQEQQEEKKSQTNGSSGDLVNSITGAFGTYYQRDISSSGGRATGMTRRSSKSRDRTPSYSRSTSYDELKFDYNSKYFKPETFAKRKVSDKTVK